MENRMDKAFTQWKQKNKKNRINAICKPCWELNYCPYGTLVENFPITENDEQLCRIFGHVCPVFIVAEPFTETKKLRSITRNIPQVVKFKVLRRDNQVCQECKKNVLDEEMNFDHIIPWSKGGSSDEKNIRLLCESCNKKRGSRYEDEFLTPVFQEIFYEPQPIDLDMLEDLLRLVSLWFYIKHNRGLAPTEEQYCEIIETEDIETDKFMFFLVLQVVELLTSEESFIQVKKKMNALRFRWGVKEGRIHSISETCKKFNIDAKYYIDSEMLILRRLGFILEKDLQKSCNYHELNIDLGIYIENHKILT
ncbi:HNH endonuclease [Paenibacillus antarcticus]|uniref:HNH endonuclease n=1 Tax=Paenibacillus antarcticus TaxID=253703 RepID=UPI0008387385|nr:HNH endonuclease signature motif containing protein [Paenibacillus antarcticus]